jgi:transposase
VGPNLIAADRDQLLLMPPSLADWLPEDHLAWFVLDVVAELDLRAFIDAYRADGRGGAAYDPALMVALLVYAYCVGERSSRAIERRCVEDIAFRVVAANHTPDHATVARFRATHEHALGALFAQVLALCARAGMIRAGLVAVDGTRMEANASKGANRTAEQLARQILEEAAAVDAEEDKRFGDAHGDELPADLVGSGRSQRIRDLLEELNAEAAERSYEAHLERRAEAEAARGKSLPGRRPKPDSAAHRPRRVANTTDPDSRLLKVTGGYLQGYNAQAVVTVDQLIVAAEVTNDAIDTGQFGPMVRATKTNLRRAGVKARVRTVLADAGYWSNDNAQTKGVEALIAPGKSRDLDRDVEAQRRRDELLDDLERGDIDINGVASELGVGHRQVRVLIRRRREGSPGPKAAMTAKLATPRARRLYKKRASSVEPVFGQTKHDRGMRRFSRRGLAAVDGEWKLIAATHNLRKLWRWSTAPSTA